MRIDRVETRSRFRFCGMKRRLPRSALSIEVPPTRFEMAVI